MTKKYYAWFYSGENEYVIRFKIKGSLQWDPRARCFVDKDWYTRGIDDVVCYAVYDNNATNVKSFGGAMLLTHEQFVEMRARGYKRLVPMCEVLVWD